MDQNFCFNTHISENELKKKIPIAKTAKKKKEEEKPSFFLPVISAIENLETFLGKWEVFTKKKSSFLKYKSETNLESQ